MQRHDTEPVRNCKREIPPLTAEQSARLQSLWLMNQDVLRRWAGADDHLSELGEVLSRPTVLQIIGDDPSNRSFLNLARRCLRLIVLRAKVDCEHRRRCFWRWLRRAKPKMFEPPTAEENLMRQEAVEGLLRDVESLDPLHRSAVTAYFLREQYHEAAADSLGCHERTQRRRVKRALTMLREVSTFPPV